MWSVGCALAVVGFVLADVVRFVAAAAVSFVLAAVGLVLANVWLANVCFQFIMGFVWLLVEAAWSLAVVW